MSVTNFPPESKLLFFSQESSADLVQEALSLGALGCVVKTTHWLLSQAVHPRKAVCEHIGERRPTLPLKSVNLTPPNATGSGIDRSLDGAPLARRASSLSGVMNREEPQSRQTTSLGNTQTQGLSRFLRPLKWMRVSSPTPPDCQTRITEKA